MKVLRGLPTDPTLRPSVLVIGVFDGVHQGHQSLLTRVGAMATSADRGTAVMLLEPKRRFPPQPQAGLPLVPSPRLSNLRDKVQLLACHGVQAVAVVPLHAGKTCSTAEHIVAQLLRMASQLRHLVVADELASHLEWDSLVAKLQAIGMQFGFTVHFPSPATADQHLAAVTATHLALKAGNVALAGELLGHPYAISGRVVHGKKLGRMLGFPTMNLQVTHVPALSGVFVVRVHGLTAAPMSAVACLGVRPTVDTSGRALLEVHILDSTVACYGKLIRVEFLEKLRDEETYSGIEALTIAIADDVSRARRWFAGHAGVSAPTSLGEGNGLAMRQVGTGSASRPEEQETIGNPNILKG